MRNDRKVTRRLAMVDGPLRWPVEAKPGLEKLACLRWRHGIEHSPDREATLGRWIEIVSQISRGDEGSVEVFELYQHLVDLADLPAPLTGFPAVKEAVDLIDQ